MRIFLIFTLLLCAAIHATATHHKLHHKQPPKCNDNCSGDSTQVCGYDGKEYRLFDNKCYLNLCNCRDNEAYDIVNMKYCKPPSCNDIKCTDNDDPTCGQDGNTYKRFRNECEMEKCNCRYGTEYQKTKYERCQSKQNCPELCPTYVHPVCGRCNNEYRKFKNYCNLVHFNCNNKKQYKEVHMKNCEPDCVMEKCSKDKDLVCATNGDNYKTFTNECEMNNYNCKNNDDYERTKLSKCNLECPDKCPDAINQICAKCGTSYKSFRNPCYLELYNSKNKDECNQVHDSYCEEPATCTIETCTDPKESICATDGKTFLSFTRQCELDNYNCKHQTDFYRTKLSNCNEITCPIVCPSFFKPVCAKCGKTYRSFSSQCALDIYNCNSSDECEEVNIHYCDKPTECELAKCSKTKDPVCGTNGIDYKNFNNQCELNNYNCKNKVDYKRTKLSKCQMDCPDSCSELYKPVCAKCGRSYKIFPNACFFNLYNCKYNDECNEVHRSWCDENEEECSIKKCDDENDPLCATDGTDYLKFKNQCDLDNYNCKQKSDYQRTKLSKCKISCQEECPNGHKPVCALCGKIYRSFSNACYFDRYNCRYNDVCEQVEKNYCSSSSECKIKKCGTEIDFICATDGTNYVGFQNQCDLDNYNCRHKTEYRATNSNKCKPPCAEVCPTANGQSICARCGDQYRNFTNECYMNQYNCQNDQDCEVASNSYCGICPLIKCSNIGDGICTTNGSNYLTFVNECQLTSYNCQNNQNYTVTDSKYCKKCQIFKCPPNLNDPTCAVDNGEYILFENKCQLKNYNCKNNKDFEECDLSNCGVKQCQIYKCPSHLDDPICATNGIKPKLFKNKCELNNYNCEKNDDYVETDANKCGGKNCQIYKCPPNLDDPTCGVQGKDYKLFKNKCELNNYNCENDKDYQSTDITKCGGCQKYKCPKDLDDQTCATNGNEYKLFKNKCELNNYNCDQGTNYTSTDITKCGGCQKYKCPKDLDDPTCATNGQEYKLFRNKCELNNYNCDHGTNYEECDLANCKSCPDVCEKNYKPVCSKCGKKYQKYDNLCLMEKYACDNDQDCKQVDKVFCECLIDNCPSTGPQICATDGTQTMLFNNSCELKKYNCEHGKVCTKVDMSYCECQIQNCSNVKDLTCSVDGDENMLFYNECEMENYNCENGKNFVRTTNLSVCDQGPCTSDCPISDTDVPVCSNCGDHYEIFNNTCLLGVDMCNNDDRCGPPVEMSFCVPKCSIVDCNKKKTNKKDKPICATDGVTYINFKNQCQLDNYNCKYNVDFKITDIAYCQSVCTRKCPKNYAPVCGNMGTIYRIFDNQCIMDQINCYSKPGYVKVSMDLCKKCEIRNCTADGYHPVCAKNNDGELNEFDNSCDMKNYNCANNQSFAQTDTKNCDSVCTKYCEPGSPPVCGQLGAIYKIFDNQCEFDKYNCYNKPAYVKVDLSFCSVCKIRFCPIATPSDFIACATNGFEYLSFDSPCAMNNYNCGNHETFHQVANAECMCPLVRCANIGPLICATDGINFQMFDNMCLLNSYNCNNKKYFVPASLEYCSGNYTICANKCLNEYNPICVSNSRKEYKLYPNTCSLILVNYESNDGIKIVNMNYCKNALPTTCTYCEYNSYSPICGQQQDTYYKFGSECALEFYNCYNNEDFEKVDNFSFCN